MAFRFGPLICLLAVAATPARAAIPASTKADAARFDAAVLAGHSTILALSGRTPVLKAETVGCTTHLKTAADDFEVDWSSSSINAGLTKGGTLMISEGPTQDFAITFSLRTQIAIARNAAEHLSGACGG